MITHFKYWNKWRKKFPNAYSKWTKFLVLIGLKKPYTFRMMMLVDRYNGAVVSFNRLTEIFNQASTLMTKAATVEVKSDEKQQHRGLRAKANIYDEAWRDKEGATSDELSEV